MVSTRGRGRGRGRDGGRGRGGGKTEVVAENGENIAEYEESRAQRIKENMERMKSLGIFDLSKQLKPPRAPSLRKTKSTPAPSNDPPRRSSRLKESPAVSYTEKRTPKKESRVKNVEIHIPQGKNPEVYTEEHEKLLGDSEAVWELGVDGFDEDGQRMYDPFLGKSCHQCRQKTVGQRTRCCKCDTVKGQFCGDCLYTRYGENITEVNHNPEWVCPVCRGICNCSRCRRDKGWEPTGNIYRKVEKLGYKSVAHYLIYPCRGQAMIESPISIDEKGPSDAIDQIGAEKNETIQDNVKGDSDEEYRQDDYEDEDDDDDDDNDDDDSQ